MQNSKAHDSLTKRCLTAAVAGLAIAALSAWAMYDADANKAVLRAACDGLFIVSVLYLGLSGLTLAANDGFFTIFSYGISSAVRVMFHPGKDFKIKQSFPEYKQEKMKKRRNFAHFLACGVVFLAVSVVLSAFY